MNGLYIWISSKTNILLVTDLGIWYRVMPIICYALKMYKQYLKGASMYQYIILALLVIYKFCISTPCHNWHASVPLLTIGLCTAFVMWSRLAVSWNFSTFWLSEWSHVLYCRGYDRPWLKLKSQKHCMILTWSIRQTPLPNTWVAGRRENCQLALQLLGTLGFVNHPLLH